MNRRKFLVALSLGFAPLFVSAKKALNLFTSGPVVGGGCDGCELMYEGMPTRLSNTTHLPGWNAAGQKMMVHGAVYRKDGRTPAPNITLYIYHTDSKGYYSTSPGQTYGKRHGHLRGWVKTGCDGKYTFYTTLPAQYPDETMPAHIHPVVKEPGINEYYIDEYQFEGDSLLTPKLRRAAENRGGPGIIKLTKNSTGLLICRRDIILGLNIPYYK